QVFQGVVIRRQGGGARETFTVRKISYGVGVERTFPVHTPAIETIEVVTRGQGRRAKLYYLRSLRGKPARTEERREPARQPPAAPGWSGAPGRVWAAGPGGWPLGWMVMMDDEQRAGDVLAGPGSAAAIGRTDKSGLGAERDARTPEAHAEGAQDAPEQDDDAEVDAPRSRWSLITEMVVLFAVALAIALLIKTFVVQPFYIPSASMENTLQIGDKVLVNKIIYRIRPISRGDIVVFNGAGSWLPPTAATAPVSHNPFTRLYDVTLGPFFRSVRELFGTAPGQTDYIKRVIGIPGDHVACCNAQGEITVNGVPLHEQSY